ncbi:MAG: DMT family transporter, partial [Pseudomonadota bacterium]
ISMALTVLPFVVFVPPPPLALWPGLLLAVVVHWFYQTGLVRALHRGDLSLVFPVMRGLAPLIVAVLAMAFLGEGLSPAGWIGLLIASAAVIVFALPPRSAPAAKHRHPDRAALAYACATALGIGAYSVTDAFVIRQMPSPYTFIVYLFLLDWIGIAVVTLITRRGQVWARVRPQLKAGLLAGVAGALSYGAALYAFTLTDAAIVTALRETSVVWAALMGAIWLKEGFGSRRVMASLLLAAGLVIMQVLG